jgi:hypothetical protein
MHVDLGESPRQHAVIESPPWLIHKNIPETCCQRAFHCQAVIKALREREAQLLTVQALEADIARKHKALGVLDEQVTLTFLISDTLRSSAYSWQIYMS